MIDDEDDDRCCCYCFDDHGPAFSLSQSWSCASERFSYGSGLLYIQAGSHVSAVLFRLRAASEG